MLTGHCYMEELKKKLAKVMRIQSGAIEKLKKYGKKTMLKTELEHVFAVSSDEELFEIVSILSEQQILTPIKNSKTNGNRLYPIYMKYKISLPQENYETELKEINALHPLLQRNRYLLSNPKEYKKYRSLIQKLDHYLFARSGKEIAISRKERSFEIFDEEKTLDDKTFNALLTRIGVLSSVLAFYDTPEYCFNDYIPDRKTQMTLLICENKDIWFNIRRMMFENNATNIFDTYIDGVVYGCGNKICAIGALTAYTEFIGSKVKYLYWGDIDREGLNIYLGAVRANPNIDIKLFVPAYEEMLRLARTKNMPDSKDERNRIENYSGIYDLVDKNLRTIFEQSIQKNKRIPQEIITYAFLRENMR